MRKIYGPKRTEDGYWGIKTNQEIDDILKGQNIIRLTKKQRLTWLGHVESMVGIILCTRLQDGNPCLKDQLEDLKHVGKMMFRKI